MPPPSPRTAPTPPASSAVASRNPRKASDSTSHPQPLVEETGPPISVSRKETSARRRTSDRGRAGNDGVRLGSRRDERGVEGDHGDSAEVLGAKVAQQRERRAAQQRGRREAASPRARG